MNEEIIYNIGFLIGHTGINLAAIYISWKTLKFIWPKLPITTKKIIHDKQVKDKAFSLVKLIFGITLLSVSGMIFLGTIGIIIKRPLDKFKFRPETLFDDSKNPQKICGIGCDYLYGMNGVEKNLIKAKECFEKAAKLNNPEAFFILGNLYENGLGTEINTKKAFIYYHSAAKKNYDKAQTLLGVHYILGEEIKRDIETGLKYLELASKQNCEQALFFLGNLYESGNYIPQDMLRAKQCYSQAVLLNDQHSQLRLGLIYQQEGNFKEAKKLLEDASNQGEDEATTQLGILYLNGTGTTKNPTRAKELFEKAAQKENTNALTTLGVIYMEGLGVNQNFKKSKFYLKKAAKQNSSQAQMHLGYLYAAGYGVKQNIEKAKKHISAAIISNPNDENAQVILQILNDPAKQAWFIEHVKLIFSESTNKRTGYTSNP